MADVTEEHHTDVAVTEEKETKGSSSQSEALKSIVDYEEEVPDVNTELFRSTIRTTPLDSDKEQIGVDELLHPDGLTSSEKDAKSEEVAAGKTVQNDALKAANDSADEDEEELEGYVGEEEKKEAEDWTIVRCSSVDNSSVEDGAATEEKMEEDKGSIDKVREEDSDEDKSFEIIDEKEVEETKEDAGKQDGDATEKDCEGLETGDDSRTHNRDTDTKDSDEIRKVSPLDEEDIVKFGGIGLAKDKGGERIEVTDGMDDPLGINRGTTSPKDGVNADTTVEAIRDEKDEDSKEDAGETEENSKAERDLADNIPSSSMENDEKRKSLPEFDELQVGSILDTNAQKSRARLAKTGVLAQRRKPPRSSWYFEEGKNMQFMFTDSTQPKPLKDVKEDDDKRPIPSTKTPPKPTRRPPPGAMGGLMLSGLSQIKLKKTPTDPVKSPRATKSLPLAKSPPPAATKPSSTTRSPFGARVKKQPAHSKGKAPTPPEGKSSIPIFPHNTSSKSPTEKVTSPKELVSSKQTLGSPKEVVVTPKKTTPSALSFTSPLTSPKEPLVSPKDTSSVFSPKESLLSPKGSAFRLPPPAAAKPTVKSRPKPLPKPRPHSISSATDPSFKKSASSRDDLNSDLLNNKVLKSPHWMSDKNKKLPPITSPVKKTSDETDPSRLPKWKQDLLKKKKEQEASGIKRPIGPPQLPKKDAEPKKTPQWQLNLAEKNRKKKVGDTKEDAVSRPAKERKTEDSNKIEHKKPPLNPKPVIAPKKKFEAIPPEKQSAPSLWQKNSQEKRKMNEKNLLIDNGEKKDCEKRITPSTKKDLPPLINSNIPLWKLEIARKNNKLFQRLNHADVE